MLSPTSMKTDDDALNKFNNNDSYPEWCYDF